MKAWLIPISLVLLADTAHADQCSWVEHAIAKEAHHILDRSPTYLEFCEPCGDKAPGIPQLAKSVTIAVPEPDSDYRELSINGKAIDIAYVFVKTGDTRFENLAALAGCGTNNVSPSLTISAETTNGVLITAAADPVPAQATPEPATIVTSIPAPMPPAPPPPPQVFIYTTTTHEIAWLAVVLAAGGGFITGSALMLALVTIRRRRAMRPRAMDIAARG
jgi:hypothetical protein